MISYDRIVKITGFHVLEERGRSAQVQYSFQVEVPGIDERVSLTEWFTNIGDAPHIGESIDIIVQVFETDNGTDTWTVERN